MNKGLVLQGNTRSAVKDIQRSDELRSRETTEHCLNSNRAKHLEKARQLEGSNSVISNHVDRFRVIAEKGRAASRGPPPQGLTAKRELVVRESEGDTRVQNPAAKKAADWSCACGRREICGRNLLLRARIRSLCQGHSLELSHDVRGEGSRRCPESRPGVEICP